MTDLRESLPPLQVIVNDVRALRVAEIVQDFRTLQHYIAQIQAYPTPEEYYAEGYVLLRQCTAEGQAVLHASFPATSASPNGDPEAERAHLQYIMLDASARRFQAQRIYLRATAAMRWINSRNAVIQGQSPTPDFGMALHQIDQGLSMELSGITDERTYDDLRTSDIQQGKWVNEDPDLGSILLWLASQSQSIMGGEGLTSPPPSSRSSAGGRRRSHR